MGRDERGARSSWHDTLKRFAAGERPWTAIALAALRNCFVTIIRIKKTKVLFSTPLASLKMTPALAFHQEQLIYRSQCFFNKSFDKTTPLDARGGEWDEERLEAIFFESGTSLKYGSSFSMLFVKSYFFKTVWESSSKTEIRASLGVLPNNP
jgi:hypothetical protein